MYNAEVSLLNALSTLLADLPAPTDRIAALYQKYSENFDKNVEVAQTMVLFTSTATEAIAVEIGNTMDLVSDQLNSAVRQAYAGKTGRNQLATISKEMDDRRDREERFLASGRNDLTSTG